MTFHLLLIFGWLSRWCVQPLTFVTGPATSSHCKLTLSWHRNLVDVQTQVFLREMYCLKFYLTGDSSQMYVRRA
ncbi:hypothetical protein IW261DRAFT_1512510 [Armillaria novae-zelandiae]|uniref:Secreted protein n=1 Tax=Armillaria novae-zelandiae TaxID=153914 RepID=A0AA39T898_9AGAR|nr:hypothetical protein IW261DRAFT_1512510 [Armillaria novae-zelandiae]